MIKERVKKYICENTLLEKGDKVIVAFSGGADSVCLLHLLYSLKEDLGISVSAAHLHHGIRGKEADDDAEFAKNFCGKYDIPFHIEYKDVPLLAKKYGISEEEAGRNARYEFFANLKNNTGASKIATAHNKNDNAETILHHIIRGTGTDGITGISVKRDDIIRPILFLLREEIETYCKENNLEFVTDSTNLTQDYTRNKIRLGLLEYLKEFNPNIISTLCMLGDNALPDKDFLEKETCRNIKNMLNEDEYGVFFDIEALKKQHQAIQRRLIISAAKSAGIAVEYKHVISIISLINDITTGKRIDLPGGFAEVSYSKLYFKTECTSQNPFCYEIKSGENVWDGTKIVCENPESHKIIWRSRKEGDKILVGGMHKKVKKILIDKKVPLFKREKIGVITVDGELAAIPGIIKGDILKQYNIKLYCEGFTNE